jgi:hypothetical protein
MKWRNIQNKRFSFLARVLTDNRSIHPLLNTFYIREITITFNIRLYAVNNVHFLSVNFQTGVLTEALVSVYLLSGTTSNSNAFYSVRGRIKTSKQASGFCL